MATHSSYLPGEAHGQRSLVGYSPKGRKELDISPSPKALFPELAPQSRPEESTEGSDGPCGLHIRYLSEGGS